MKVNIRFKEGVAAGLCGSCDDAMVMVDDRDQCEVLCFYTHPAIKIRRIVKQCSGYTAKGSQSQHDFEKIAWVLEFKKGKPIGFRPPKAEKE